MFYVGIDIAKKNHEASIINSTGKLLDKSISFSNSQAGCAKLVSLLEYSKLFSDTFGVTSREILSKYPTPEDMLSIDTDTLVELLSKASKGRFGISKANEIQESASNTFGVSFAKNAFAFQIKQIIAQINFIEDQLEELEIEISTLLHRTNSVITTITGIGDVL